MYILGVFWAYIAERQGRSTPSAHRRKQTQRFDHYTGTWYLSHREPHKPTAQALLPPKGHQNQALNSLEVRYRVEGQAFKWPQHPGIAT